MPRKGENIRKRKDGLWEGRYMREPGKYTSVYARSYAEVKDKLLAAKLQPEQSPSNKNLYRDVLAEWLEVQALRVKPSSHEKFRNLVNGHIVPSLGELSLAEISTTRLTRFLQEKAKHGRLDGRGGLSVSSLQSLLLILKSSLDYAARERYMQPMAFSIKCPEIPREAAKALTTKEQARLERTLCGTLDTSKLGILICLYTGMRIGEVCALLWSDIDLTQGLIHVRRTVQRLQIADNSKTALSIGSPKSECSRRSVPFPPCLRAPLRRFYGRPDAHILTGNNKPMEPRTYQYRFQRYVADADLAGVNFHMLRHSFATRFIELGGDAKTLSELLGHKSVEITLNKYVHPTLDMKRRQMERFSSIRGMDCGTAA